MEANSRKKLNINASRRGSIKSKGRNVYNDEKDGHVMNNQ